MDVFPACMCMYPVLAVPPEARRGRQLPGTGITDSCKLPCRCWTSKPGPLEEQPALLPSEPSPQPLAVTVLCIYFAVIAFNNLVLLYCFMCMNIWLACMYVYHRYAWGSWGAGVRTPRAGVTDSCGAPCT